MVRKASYYLVLGFLILIPGHVFSLGLGDISVDSVLNQPLQAQINLISARVEELEELRVELAPTDVFDRVGVPRPYFLTQLKFEPVSLPNGRTAIRVTSKDPVREPFLTFLVEVTWPKGRLLREYTVLLDPPEFAQQQAPQISTPAAAPAQPPQVVEAEPTPEVSEEPVAAAPTPEVSAERVATAPAEPEIAEPTAVAGAEDDIEQIRARMDRALGIDHSEPVVRAEEPTDSMSVDDVVEAEPTAEELEEAVVEETQEVVSEAAEDDVIAAEDIASKEEVEETETVEVVDEEPIAEDVIAGEYTTVKGDTLFSIAEAARGSTEITVNQMMLAIQQANPDAFIRNNINLLKSGVVLRIPDNVTSETIIKAEATSEVSRQNALWREYKQQVTEKIAAANVDAPDLVEEKQEPASDLASEAKEALEETTDKAAQSQQDLKILADEGAKQPASDTTQVAGTEELEKVQKELTLSKELAQSRVKENEELQSRVEALESMLEKKDKIINIQSQQLNDLSDQLNTQTNKALEAEKLLQEKTTSETPVETKQQTPAPEASVEEVKPPVVEPLPDFDEPMQAEQTISKPKLEPLPDWDSLPEIEIPAEDEVVAEATPTEEVQEAKPVEEPKQPEQPEVTPEVAETGIMATLMGYLEPVKQHWAKLAAGLGALAVLGGLLSIRRRRSAQRIQTIGMGMPEALEDDQFDDILDETIITPKEAPAKPPEPSEQTSFEPTADIEAEAEATEPATAEGTSPDDVLEEADVYISYGLHQQAQDLLTDAIAAEPNRKDYKVKLAEVFYSSKNQAAFEQHAQSVKDQLGESSSEWQNIIAMGKEIAPTSALFAGAAAVGMAASVVTEKPDAADIDIGLQTAINEPMSDDDLEDTVVDNTTSDKDEGVDFDVDAPVFADDDADVAAFADDPVASKIMEANETSDILNFEVDDLADDLESEENMDTAIEAAATGIHEATGLHEAIHTDMQDMTEELEEVGLQTTMDDLKPLDLDEEDIDTAEQQIDTTVALQTDDDFGMGLDTEATPDDPDATAAYAPNIPDQEDTEQFDASNIDTEFLDPAEATVAQTATDLHELGPPSLIEEVGTKLDLAKAFVDMGDSDAARETLIEVISEGDESQVKAAKDLMDKLGG